MKKIIVLLLVACMVLFVGCNENKNTETKGTSAKSTETTTKSTVKTSLTKEEKETIENNKRNFESNKCQNVYFDMSCYFLYYNDIDEDKVVNDYDKDLPTVSTKNIKVTTYKLSDSNKKYHNYLIANLHNDGKDNLIVRMYVEFLDNNGEVMGSDLQTVKTLSSKSDYPLRFTGKYEFENFRYTLKAYNTDSINVGKIIKSKITKNNNVISLKATNKSDGCDVIYTTVAVMLFDNGRLVDFLDGAIGEDHFSGMDYGLQLTENNSAIKIFNCNKKYDTAKVYFDGYAKYMGNVS
ncbi:MAG: hypothetical protein PUC69_01865 [Ruminococcus sp.]|nr:hypothetical protein [Ruminococcus sp.]MDD5889348.1 hypothetical protein [Ruminococcus sp.]